jgi:hypothetical protein
MNSTNEKPYRLIGGPNRAPIFETEFFSVLAREWLESDKEYDAQERILGKWEAIPASEMEAVLDHLLKNKGL